MSGFMKTVLISTQPAWHFSKNIHRLLYSINHRQSVTTQPTPSPCLCLAGWLAGCQLLTLLGIGGQSLPCKNPLSVTHPTSLGLNPGGPAWNQLVARHLACLPQPSLTEVPPPSPGFQAQQRRKAGAKVLPEIWRGFHKFRHTYFCCCCCCCGWRGWSVNI